MFKQETTQVIYEAAPAPLSVIRQGRTVAKLVPADLFAVARAKAMGPRAAATARMSAIRGAVR